jgi:hypothetical protein
LFAIGAPQAKAAFTDHFDALLAELQERSVALSNSTDRTDIKQKRACDKAIKIITNSTVSVVSDLKAAGKCGKILQHAFTNEFPVVTSVAIASVAFTNSLQDLVSQVFTDLQDDTQSELDELQTLISVLPDAAAKTKCQSLLNLATTLITKADLATNYTRIANFLIRAVKAALKGQVVATNAGGGGGGGGGTNGLSAVIMIADTNDNWVADESGAEWVQSSGSLDISGGRGINSFLSVALCTNFKGAAGVYALGNNCGSYVVSGDFFLITAGTLNIATFDTNTTSLSGTFAFDASDGSTTITVTNGQFNLNNLTITP